jgi:hypothetical protein
MVEFFLQGLCSLMLGGKLAFFGGLFISNFAAIGFKLGLLFCRIELLINFHLGATGMF